MCPNCGEGDLDFELCPNTHDSECVYCCPCHRDEA